MPGGCVSLTEKASNEQTCMRSAIYFAGILKDEAGNRKEVRQGAPNDVLYYCTTPVISAIWEAAKRELLRHRDVCKYCTLADRQAIIASTCSIAWLSHNSSATKLRDRQDKPAVRSFHASDWQENIWRCFFFFGQNVGNDMGQPELCMHITGEKKKKRRALDRDIGCAASL